MGLPPGPGAVADGLASGLGDALADGVPDALVLVAAAGRAPQGVAGGGVGLAPVSHMPDDRSERPAIAPNAWYLAFRVLMHAAFPAWHLPGSRLLA